MNVLNKEDIRKFLKHFTGRDPHLSDCLYLALSGPLQREPSCLREIQDEKELCSPLLRRKFNHRSNPWFHFVPDEAAEEKCKTVCLWLMDFLTSVDYDLTGELKRQAKIKLRVIKGLDQAVRLAGTGPLMSRDEISRARAARLVPDEERRGHFRHECKFEGGMNLYRIMTTAGMDAAGEKASNCLNKADAPDRMMPHRRRVRHPETWQYFLLLDVDNRAVATFMTDGKKPCVEYEGNAGKNIRGDTGKIVLGFINYLSRSQPDFMKMSPQIGYSGGLPGIPPLPVLHPQQSLR